MSVAYRCDTNNRIGNGRWGKWPFFIQVFGSSWSSATLCQVRSPTRYTFTSNPSSVDHLLLCLLCRFTAVGVHSAAQLSQVTMEDYPILGISSTEDRTQLLQLVQTLKSLDLWCEADDSECNSSDSDGNHHVVGDGLTHCSCLGPDEDVYDLSGTGKRLDFSGKTLSHHQKRSCYPAHVHVSARHDRNAQAGQHKEAAGPLHPQILELRKSNSWIDYHNTKTDPHRDSTSRPPHISSHKLSSETLPSMQLSNRLVWQQERKGISKNEKLCTEKSRRKTLEQKAVTMPVYESRTAGYNYGLPLSSPPVQNKRWVWVGEQCSFPSSPMCLLWETEHIFKFSKDFWHGVDHKIMQKITANMGDNSFVTHFIHQSLYLRPLCFFYHRINDRLFLFQLQCHWLIQWNSIFFFSVFALCELQATEATADQCMREEKTSDSHWVQERRSRCCDNFERSVCDCKRKKRGSGSLPVCSTGIYYLHAGI